jgi:Chaperone of endosialidase
MGGHKKLFGAVTDAVGITNRSGDAAASAQAAAAKQANDTTWKMYDQSRKDMEPWRQAGQNALGQITGDMGNLTKSFTLNDFQQDPGYQFRMQEGQKAIERGAAARGGLMGGRALKEISRYGQDFASNEYNNAYNRVNNDRDQRFNKLSSLAGVGQTSASQIANSGMQAGQQVAQNQIGIGNAQAANIMGQQNRLQGMIGQGAGAAMMFSDERLKTDIKPVSKEDLQEIKDKVRAYKFKYKDQTHGEGDFVGVMAQELEQTKLGKDLVSYDSEGYRLINTHKLMSLLLATLAEA